MEEKRGILLVCEAVTMAAQLVAQLKRQTALDKRDQMACELVQRKLEQAEQVLYGK